MHFFRRAHAQPPAPAQAYDPAQYAPVIRCSICTGEQVAGFQDKKTGRFIAVTLLQSPRDLQDFCQTHGLKPDEVKKIY